MFAIVEINGVQEKVTNGSVITVPYMSEKNSGDEVLIDKVLLFSDEENVLIGTPVLEGFSVSTRFVGHSRADKVIAFKKKRRTGYKRKIGHIQELSRLEVLSINKGN